MEKRKRTYNVRLLRATWPYTVQEVAKLFHVHKNAPLRWIKEGLRASKGDRGEFLIRGDALVHFLTERKKSKKHTCAINQFRCFTCRAPREAYLNIADIIFVSPTRFRVKAICAVCSTRVSKWQGIKNLAKIQNTFHVQQQEGQHIIESVNTSINSDSETLI